MNKKQILEFLLESNTSISFTQVCFSLLMAVIIGGENLFSLPCYLPGHGLFQKL